MGGVKFFAGMVNGSEMVVGADGRATCRSPLVTAISANLTPFPRGTLCRRRPSAAEPLVIGSCRP